MPVDSLRCDKTLGPVHFEHCINCAASGQARERFGCLHSPDVIRGIINKIRAPMDCPSVTELLECPRAYWLKKKNDYAIQPSRAYWAFRGTMIHQVIEEGKQEGDIAEKRFFAEIGGFKISGQPDLVRGNTLYDWKTAKKIPSEPKEDHKIQLSCYRLILKENGIEVSDDARIVYMDMSEHAMLPVKLWNLQETEKWMVERLSHLQEVVLKEEPPSFEKHFSLSYWKCGRSEAYSYCEVRRECTKGQTAIDSAPPAPRRVRKASKG